MFHQSYLWLIYGAEIIFLLYLVYQYMLAQKNKPVIPRADIVYQEWFASGHSEANFLTKFGGARNCLRLLVTTQCLVVTSWFPFSLFSAFYDLEHVVPLATISRVEQKQTLGMKYLLVVYQDSQGKAHRIGLMPRNQHRFLEAISHTVSFGD